MNNSGVMKEEKDLVREVHKGIILWYDLKLDSRVLYDGEKDDPVCDALREMGANVDAFSHESCNALPRDTYDYVVSVAGPEKKQQPLELLKQWKACLKPEGRLLLAMNNRMGLRYFCGDRDPYTNRNFDGIEGYQRAYRQKEDVFMGRCYDESELREMVALAGFEKSCFFSVLSDLHEPIMLYREDFTPREDLATRVASRYEFPETIFLPEESLYSGMIKNGLFHKTANAYFIECFDIGEPKDVWQATLSLSRGAENALITILKDNRTVEKRAVYPEGEERLATIQKHMSQLQKQGLCVVDSIRNGRVLSMPFVDAPIGQTYLKELLKTDVNAFLQAMDHFRDLILQSSEHIREEQGDGEGVLLKEGFIDMVPLNSFFQDGEFVFFDQEFCVENYPANAIISRMVCTFYERNLECVKYYPQEKLLERYGLLENRDYWRKMDTEFFRDILDCQELKDDRRKHYPDYRAIDSNRLRVNYTSDEYQKIFVDIFEGLDNKELILFGSGNFAKRFLELYGPDYEVSAIIDNKQENWGQIMNGIEICPPEMVKDLPVDSYRVLICIKNFPSILQQMYDLGVKDYCVYDAAHNYPRKRKPIQTEVRTEDAHGVKKPYHIGYVAGVFDLFHIGHLNLLRNAKELCDYLIVGVVGDDGVKRDKQKETFISLEERKEIVAACRYVDEVVEVPPTFSSVEETFNLYHYDVQFSGNDHANDPAWLDAKAYLNKHGSDIYFFPYTESTSSTKLKDLISQKLL